MAKQMCEPPAIVPVCLMSFTAFDILAVRERNGYRVLKDVEHWLPVATGTLHNYPRALFLDKPARKAWRSAW